MTEAKSTLAQKKDVFLPIFAFFFFLKQGHPLNLPCKLCATLLPFMTTSCLLQIKSGCFDSTDMFIARCNIFYLVCFIINGCLCASSEEKLVQVFCQVFFFFYRRLTKVKT